MTRYLFLSLRRYAVYLGMEPTEDTDLLWIAEEALTAGEPEGWTEQMDPNGNLYYYNGNYGFSPTPRLSKTCPSNAPPSLGFVFLLFWPLGEIFDYTRFVQ